MLGIDVDNDERSLTKRLPPVTLCRMSIHATAASLRQSMCMCMCPCRPRVAVHGG
jgi:hypothetical protein